MARRPAYPQSARRHYLLSALLARRAVTEAQKARSNGTGAVVAVVATHQLAQARLSGLAVPQILTEQGIPTPPAPSLNLPAFTTEASRVAAMLDVTQEFDRLVASLVQDAGRAAESVATTVRPNIYHVRFLNLPSCSRCAVLAGRVYRYSDGFLRHPNCDCVMIPTTVANHHLVQDPAGLADSGQVTGLSKADLQAIRDGADFGQVVNVRNSQAGLRASGAVLGRKGRPTPEGIYRMTSTRNEAVALLGKYGYITP